VSIFVGDEFTSEDERREGFVSFIQEEVGIAEGEISERKEKWEAWRKLREAASDERTVNYPFPNSASMVVPLAGTLAQGIYGKLMQGFNNRIPFFTVTAQRKTDEDAELAEFGTDYLQMIASSKQDLDLMRKVDGITYEATSLGTQFVKVPYTIRRKKFVVSDDLGNPIEREMTEHDGPEIVLIQQEDMLFRRNEGIPFERQPWLAHRLLKTENELLSLQDDGIFDPDMVEAVLAKPKASPRQAMQEELDRQGVNPNPSKLYELYEVFAEYDVDGDGLPEEVIVTLSLDAGVVLREGYNEIGRRPFKPVIYFQRAFFVEGQGVVEKSESMNREATSFHRMRFNNAHIAGLRMFGVKKSSGIRANEKIYPGKLWFLDDPKSDLVPIQAGEVYPSSLQAEQVAVDYAQRFTGFSDVMGGFADPTLGTRDTFRGQALRSDMGAGILSSVSQGMQAAFGDIGQLIMFQLIAHRERVISNEKQKQRLTDEQILMLEKLLDVPVEEIPNRFTFSVKTTKLEETFETKRQNLLVQSQLYDVFFQTMAPVLMQTFGPGSEQIPQNVKEFMLKYVVGKSKTMEEVFKLFGEIEPEDAVPEYRTYEKLLEFAKINTNALLAQMEEDRGLLEGPARGAGEEAGVAGNAGEPGVQGGFPGNGQGQGIPGGQGGGTPVPGGRAGEVGVF
jgi:hypothetical protein